MIMTVMVFASLQWTRLRCVLGCVHGCVLGASTLLQRVFSFQLRASLFGEFNIDGINIDINIVIDVDDKTNYFLQP